MNGLRCLLHRVIDYAGLFPPARQSLDAAIREFRTYRDGPHAWMVSRFVCPTVRMAELDRYASSFSQETGYEPWRFSAVGRSGDDAESFLNGLDADVEAIRRLVSDNEGRLLVDAFETKLPGAPLDTGDRESVLGLFKRLVPKFDSLFPLIPSGRVALFLELSFEGDWRRRVGMAIKAASQCNDAYIQNEHAPILGAKIRTGGIQASMIPPVDQVAFFIDSCRAHRVPFKATAGLHHPLRHRSTVIDSEMHGFLNVFVAAVLAHEASLPESTLCDLLAQESLEDFRFDEHAIGWKEYLVTRERIRAVRSSFAISFGSCNVAEPIEDLERLGLL